MQIFFYYWVLIYIYMYVCMYVYVCVLFEWHLIQFYTNNQILNTYYSNAPSPSSSKRNFTIL